MKIPTWFVMPQVLVGSGWPCFNMLCIPTNYLPQGATGSHFNLWWLLQWDIAGFKTGNRGGTALKTCIHSKHESTSNRPTAANKKKSKKYLYPHNCFILRWLFIAYTWTLEASFKARAAAVTSHLTPVKMSFKFIFCSEAFLLNVDYLKVLSIERNPSW